jgi:hypothetical protein
MGEYNRKFEVEPRNPEDAHRALREQDNLERIFARRSTRKISKNLSFQYEGTFYQIEPSLPNRFSATHVNILERPGKPILIEAGGKEYPYSEWGSQQGKPKVLDSKELEAYWPSHIKKKPGKRHPWR